jgi:hypothetical protein
MQTFPVHALAAVGLAALIDVFSGGDAWVCSRFEGPPPPLAPSIISALTLTENEEPLKSSLPSPPPSLHVVRGIKLLRFVAAAVASPPVAHRRRP